MKRDIYLIADVVSARSMYLRQMPQFVPEGLVLVHYSVRPSAQLGRNGFRAWLSIPDREKLEVCPCGWAQELGPHFWVRAAVRRAAMAHDVAGAPS